MTATSRARAVLGTIAAAVTIAILGACTPLDGRSVSVEVAADPAPVGAGRVEVPWWVTTTTVSTTTMAPRPTTAPTTSTPDLAAVTPTPEPATTTSIAAPTTTAPPPPATAAPVRPATERDRVVAATVSTLGSAPSRELATAALGLVRFDWVAGLPGWQLRFGEGRQGVRGLTFPGRRTIEVYIRSSDSPELLAHVIAHELGHAVDVTRFDDVKRAAWLAARGYGRDTIWFPGQSGVSDFATGAGDFAESFAWVHGPTDYWSGELGPPPNLVQGGLLAVLSGTA